MTDVVVQTNLDPETLTEVAIETYAMWVAFALGGQALAGKRLDHPSGRYAASISWRKTGVAEVVLVADERIAPEAEWIEEGTKGDYSGLKQKMLAGGRLGAGGYRYRDIPIRKDGAVPGGFSMAEIYAGGADGGGISARVGRMWTQKRPAVNASRWVRMSDRPGSSQWIIPQFAPYAPAAALADLVREKYGNK